MVVPAASHDQFADGALFRPGLNPFEPTVDRVAEVTGGFVAAFLDIYLLGEPQQGLREVPARTDVYVNVYQRGSNPPLPLET